MSSAGQIAAVPHLGRRLGGDLGDTDRGSQTPEVSEKITALEVCLTNNFSLEFLLSQFC